MPKVIKSNHLIKSEALIDGELVTSELYSNFFVEGTGNKAFRTVIKKGNTYSIHWTNNQYADNGKLKKIKYASYKECMHVYRILRKFEMNDDY